MKKMYKFLVTLALAGLSIGAAMAAIPQITSQPRDTTVTVGATATFSVTATPATGLSYKWQVYVTNTWQEVKPTTNFSGEQSRTLKITNVTNDFNGARFRCLVANSDGIATSSAVTLTVKTATPVITFTEQPQNKTIKVGQSVSFAVTATGTGTLKYQWERRASSTATWGALSGVSTNPTLYYSSVTIGMNGYQFRCKVSYEDGTGAAVYSNPATLTVNDVPPITFSAHPKDSTIKAGQSVSFAVTATGTGTLKYQWERRASSTAAWGALSGVSTNRTLYYSSVSISMNGSQFRCKVSYEDDSGAVYSNTATLTVNAAPATPEITITTQPAATTNVTQGAITGSLSVVASVTPATSLTYQWYSNTTNSNTGGTAATSAGATSASFTIPTTLTAGTYYYFCEVSATGATSKRSDVARVNVSATPVTTYTVTVSSGTGGGNFAPNDIVTITANEPPVGFKFKEWVISPSVEFTGGTSKTERIAKFRMPAQAVVATANFYDATGVDDIAAPQLTASVRGGTLHISGLTAGQTWSVYNIAGALLYQGIATADRASIPLSVRGVLIIRTGDSVIKVVN